MAYRYTGKHKRKDPGMLMVKPNKRRHKMKARIRIVSSRLINPRVGAECSKSLFIPISFQFTMKKCVIDISFAGSGFLGIF
jgi:hypothetical protein